MKKKAAFTIVAASVTALLLTAVLVIGLSTEGFGLSNAIEERGGSGVRLEKTDGDAYEYTWDPAESEVTGLDVHWATGMVDVKVTNGSLIKITEQADRGDLPENKRLQLSSSDGTLKIDWGESWLKLFDFSFFDKHRKDLTVELPKSVALHLSELVCSNVSCDILIDGCTAEEFSVHSTSGDLKLTKLSGTDLSASTVSGGIGLSGSALSGELSAETVSGEMDFSGVSAQTVQTETVSGGLRYEGKAQELHGDSVSAPLDAVLSECPETVEMEAVSGALSLTIPENDGFHADYSSVSGVFSSDFAVALGGAKSDKVVYGNGKSDFQFSTTSGNIAIYRLKE